jgi:hypothetical protein
MAGTLARAPATSRQVRAIAPGDACESHSNFAVHGRMLNDECRMLKKTATDPTNQHTNRALTVDFRRQVDRLR